jgi:hypothetical protein
LIIHSNALAIAVSVPVATQLLIRTLLTTETIFFLPCLSCINARTAMEHCLLHYYTLIALHGLISSLGSSIGSLQWYLCNRIASTLHPGQTYLVTLDRWASDAQGVIRELLWLPSLAGH